MRLILKDPTLNNIVDVMKSNNKELSQFVNAASFGKAGFNGKMPQDKTVVSPDLSTSIGVVASSDLNRTNGMINELKAILVNIGFAST